MWHLREVSYDIFAIDILSHRECDLRLMMTECIIFEDFPDTHDITLLIRDFDPDESEPWDRCLDTDILGFQGESEIFLETLDLG